MRLRVKLLGDSTTHRLDVAEGCKVQELHESLIPVAPVLSGVRTIFLSLNKKENLAGSPSSTLRSMGLCSGDAVWVSWADAPQVCRSPPHHHLPAHPTDGLLRWQQTSSDARPAPAAGDPGTSRQQRDEGTAAPAVLLQPAGTACSSDDQAPPHTAAAPAQPAAAAGAGFPPLQQASADGAEASAGVDPVQPAHEGSTQLGDADEVVGAPPAFLRRVLAASPPLYAGQLMHSPHRLLQLAVHAVMLEAGFTPAPLPPAAAATGVPQASAYQAPLPSGSSWCSCYHWHAGDAGDAGDAGGPALPVAVVRALPLGPHLVLHLLVAPSSRVSTLHLLTSRHISSATISGENVAGGPGALAGFTDVGALWRLLKDEVGLRLLAAIHFAANLPAPTGLLTLPMELKEAVLLRLSAEDLTALAGSCCEMRHLAAADLFWRPLFARVFPDASPADCQEADRRGWRWAYTRHHHTRRARQRRRCALVSQRVPRPTNPFGVPPFAPFRPPIPLGGDYDRLPMPALGIGPGVYPGAPGFRRLGPSMFPGGAFGSSSSSSSSHFRTY